MPIMTDVLKELRKDKCLTQEKTGRLLNDMSAESYAHYESGRREMPIWMLENLADMLGTSTDYILGRTADPVPYPKRGG